jgi:hypothetical protein
MADWLVFTDQPSPWITEGVGIDEQILAMWRDLRAAVVYYLRYRPGQEHPSHAKAAQESLFRYASAAEAAFGKLQLCTSNLHLCVVHMPGVMRTL